MVSLFWFLETNHRKYRTKLAYDKAVIFNYKNNLKDEKTLSYRVNSCEWGWLVKDSELLEHINWGEIEYYSILEPVEAIRRYETKKEEIEKVRISKLNYYKENYLKNKEPFYLSCYQMTKNDFDYYQRLIYDRRLVSIKFDKYFWESGLN